MSEDHNTSAPFAARTTRRRLLKAAAAGAAASTLGFPSILRAQTQGLKLGVVLPFTGVLAQPGLSMRRGIELAIDMFGEQGVRIEPIFVDFESKAENGRIAAEKAIRDGATVLTGAFDSGATISMAQAAEAGKIPLVVNVAAAPQITEQGYQYIFRNFLTAPQIVTNAVRRVIELEKLTGQNPQTAVLMAVNDTFGQSMTNAVRALWEKMNAPIKILDTISYAVTARDLSVEVARAKSLNPDLLCPITRVNDTILLVREMVKQDFNPMAIVGPGSPGPYEKAVTDALGKYGDDFITCVPWYDPTKEITRRMIDRFAKKFPNERVETNVVYGWEGIQVVADAFRRAKSTDPAELQKALRETKIAAADHPVYGGTIEFDAKGQNNNIGGVMLQIQKGQPLVVGPAEIAQAKIQFPMRKWNTR